MSETEVTTETQFDNTDDLDTFTSDFFGEKTETTEDANPQEVEQGTEDQTDSSTEGSKPDDTEITDEEVEAEETPKPKSRVQERIDELVRQREETKRESERQLAALRKEFEDALKARDPAAIKQAGGEPLPDAQNEDGTDKYPLGEFDPGYIRDLTRYTLESERVQANIKAEEDRKANEVQTARAELAQSWNEKLEPAKEKYPDLMEKGQDLLNGFSNLNQNYAEYLTTVLMSMEFGPDVLYYLSNNRDEATKIVNSGAQKATLALGRIEAKFAEAEAQKTAAKPKISKAPPPANVSARGTGGGAKTVEPDTDDLEAFEASFFKKK